VLDDDRWSELQATSCEKWDDLYPSEGTRDRCLTHKGCSDQDANVEVEGLIAAVVGGTATRSCLRREVDCTDRHASGRYRPSTR
jgi:hypothetical protein